MEEFASEPAAAPRMQLTLARREIMGVRHSQWAARGDPTNACAL
jgi:hypothetical protein